MNGYEFVQAVVYSVIILAITAKILDVRGQD